MTDQIQLLYLYDITCTPVPMQAAQTYRCLVPAKNSGEAIRKTTQYFQRIYPEVKGIDITSFMVIVTPEQAVVVV